jgi:peptidoglycan/xylan/chitin deacetylase (PgdA/CDA1 family)
MKLSRAIILAVAGLFIAVGLLLVLGQNQKETYISITFDDGYSSQYDAAKTLESYGWKGTFYIPTDSIGKNFENISTMDLQQIKDLQSRGHEIGGHGASHLKANNVSAEAYESDILEGKNFLEQNNLSVRNFAFPYGDDSKKEIVFKYFDTARSTKPCINKVSDRELCGLTLVNQNEEYKSLAIYVNELKLKGGWLVIAIHGISNDPRSDVDITPEELDWILEQLNQTNAKVMTVEQVRELNKA